MSMVLKEFQEHHVLPALQWLLLLLNIPNCPFMLRPLRHVQVSIPLWALVHLPVVVTITTAIFTPRVRLSARLLTLLEGHGWPIHRSVATPVTLCSCSKLAPICGL